MMTLIEISALVQSGVLSGIAIILCYKSPDMWAAYLSHVDATRKWEADQRSEDRKFRHDLANKVSVSLAELTVVVHELRDCVAGMCKFKG